MNEYIYMKIPELLNENLEKLIKVEDSNSVIGKKEIMLENIMLDEFIWGD